jgi:hypothetical protein
MKDPRKVEQKYLGQTQIKGKNLTHLSCFEKTDFHSLAEIFMQVIDQIRTINIQVAH